MSDGTVGHLRVGQASNASRFQATSGPSCGFAAGFNVRHFQCLTLNEAGRGQNAHKAFATVSGARFRVCRCVRYRNNKARECPSPGPRAEPWQAPNRPGRRQICTHIYDGGTSMRLLRDFSSHSTFHGKPSPRLDRLGVRWLSGSEPFTETHRRHCVTVSCRNNVKV